MKLIARIAVILAFALLVVGATVGITSTRAAAVPTPPTAVSVDSQIAATASVTTDGQTAALSGPPTGARPAGAGHAEGGAQGWQGLLKNVAIMALLVAAVDVLTRVINRLRPRRAQAPPRQRLADSH